MDLFIPLSVDNNLSVDVNSFNQPKRRVFSMFVFILTYLTIHISAGLLINNYIQAMLLCGLVGGE